MELSLVLTLLLTRKISRKGIRHITKKANIINTTITDVHDLCVLLEEEKKIDPRIKLPTTDNIMRAEPRAKTCLERSETLGITALAFTDGAFPQQLENIDDPPVILYAKGNLDLLKTDLSVAIVGTRKPTEYGIREGFVLSKAFAENGFVVVSGLANGCDTVAHRGCLAANGQTVAVLASGIDHLYPRKNESLANDILSKGGCLLSEYEPGSPPLRYYFVERDRLQSGLSKAVIVIETGLKGGTMHTVRYATEQGRKLACLSNHPMDLQNHPEIQGNRYLISAGKATPLASQEELNGFIGLLKEDTMPTSREQIPGTNPAESGTQGLLF